MTQFLRAKQAGVQKDLSAGLDSRSFAIDEVARYGISSQVSAIAYDPVQSLLAVGTSETRSGSGQIYVYGQKRVSVTLTIPRKASIRIIQFCCDKLVVVDSKNDISIFSLETSRIVTSYAPPSAISALVTDPLLDYALIGLQNGDVVAYDLDRHNLAPLSIPNLWRDKNPRARLLPVIALQFHPRDIGSLLIGYSEGAVIFSFPQNKATKFFLHKSSIKGPAGNARLIHAVWHPTGSFILTGYEDSSFIIWDVKDGREIAVRQIRQGATTEPCNGTMTARAPLFKMAWCAKDNPDDTGILIAGGRPTNDPEKGLTFLDLGPAPVYATSSWQALTDHFDKPKRQHVLPTPPNADVVDFCLIPRKNPHFAGACDPIAVIAILASGEMITLSFPSGHPITPTNQLHVSLTFIQPFVDMVALSYVERTRWLGLMESRPHGPPLLRGGAEAKRSLLRFAHRNIIQTAHADGTIRLWDIGHGDEIENEDVLQVDIARAVGRYNDIDVCASSMSSVTGELVVGLKTGEVLIFRWGRNKDYGRDLPHRESHESGLEAIVDRAEPSVKEGLLPLTMFAQGQGSVTSLAVSDVGFVSAGFDRGSLIVVDLRGPAVIFNALVNDIDTSGSKRSSFRKGHSGQQQNGRDWPTVIKFGVMMLDGEDYSSILVFVGTAAGRLLTFKLLPDSAGRYAVQSVGNINVEGHIVAVSPLNIETGEPADATQDTVASLRDGIRINGVLLVVTKSGSRLFRPPAARGASKSWENCICYSAAVVQFEAHTYVLLGAFGDGTVKAHTIPGLKEISSMDITRLIDARRIADTIITPTGLVIGWTGPSEIVVLNIWGSGQDLTRSLDKLLNPQAIIPPRPTISNLQWISGTTYVTAADMDKLIGGPDRPPSKRMIEQMRADEYAQKSIARQNTTSSTSSGTKANADQQEGYWAYMQRQIQERTENLGLAGDSMEKLENNSQGFADDVGKFVRNQKKAAIKGLITSKLGF